MNSVTCCDYDDFVKAMADETRQRILTFLMEREMNVGELTERFTISQPTISYHLAILHRAHLVIPHHGGRHTFYRANPACGFECCGEIRTRFKIGQ